MSRYIAYCLLLVFLFLLSIPATLRAEAYHSLESAVAFKPYHHGVGGANVLKLQKEGRIFIKVFPMSGSYEALVLDVPASSSNPTVTGSINWSPAVPVKRIEISSDWFTITIVRPAWSFWNRSVGGTFQIKPTVITDLGNATTKHLVPLAGGGQRKDGAVAVVTVTMKPANGIISVHIDI